MRGDDAEGTHNMRTWLLIECLVLGGAHWARGNELRILSFDAAGRLTLQEVSSASSYRVEWTTNLVWPTWSSNAPGIAGIPPSGLGTLTATVGVLYASTFYRAIAEVTNVPPRPLTNSFDLSAEDWRSVDYPFRSHQPNPTTSPLAFDGSEGHPPGSVRIGDVYPETGIAAPAPYLGDKLAFYGGRLEYDIYLRYADNTTYPAVVLNGGTTSVYYDQSSPPVNTWQQVAVPLTEAGWKVSGTGAAATEAVFKAVLSDLAGLYIYTEWHTGPDDTNVDNITMLPP